LTESRRTDFGETDLGFLFEAPDGGEIQISREFAVFLAGHPIDLRLLATEVTFVFEIRLDERPKLHLKFLEQIPGQHFPLVFAATEPLVELDAFMDGLADPTVGLFQT